MENIFCKRRGAIYASKCIPLHYNFRWSFNCFVPDVPRTPAPVLLIASPRGPSAARGDHMGAMPVEGCVAALELRGHLILLRQREQSRRYAGW